MTASTRVVWFVLVVLLPSIIDAAEFKWRFAEPGDKNYTRVDYNGAPYATIVIPIPMIALPHLENGTLQYHFYDADDMGEYVEGLILKDDDADALDALKEGGTLSGYTFAGFEHVKRLQHGEANYTSAQCSTTAIRMLLSRARGLQCNLCLF